MGRPEADTGLFATIGTPEVCWVPAMVERGLNRSGTPNTIMATDPAGRRVSDQQFVDLENYLRGDVVTEQLPGHYRGLLKSREYNTRGFSDQLRKSNQQGFKIKLSVFLHDGIYS